MRVQILDDAGNMLAEAIITDVEADDIHGCVAETNVMRNTIMVARSALELQPKTYVTVVDDVNIPGAPIPSDGISKALLRLDLAVGGILQVREMIESNEVK